MIDLKELFRSKTFIGVLSGIGIIVLALIVFSAGVRVGYRKAMFSYRWGEEYHRNFGGPRGGFIPESFGGKDDFPSSRGTFGKIISLSLPTFAVQSPEGVEKTVAVGTSTIIQRFRDTIAPADLAADEYVIVIGAPNAEGQIEAKLIRVVPPPEALRAKGMVPRM